MQPMGASNEWISHASADLEPLRLRFELSFQRFHPQVQQQRFEEHLACFLVTRCRGP
jgi:hypothetical protein